MPLRRQLILSVLLLAAVLGVFHVWDIDVWLQDRLYQGGDRWVLDHDKGVWMHAIFYSGLKTGAIVVGVTCGAALFAGLWWRRLAPLRPPLLLMSLSFVLVPSVLVGLREVTNVYGPYQLARYGQEQPYVKVFGQYPRTFNGVPYRQHGCGRCFPAGHATGGFALMMLFFALRRPLLRWLGLAAGVAVGWAMGLYQMLAGKHFLSHTLTTMIAAWILILLSVMLVNRLLPARDAGIRGAAS